MSEVIKIKKGLNIPLEGKAEMVFGQAQLPGLFAIKPVDFHGLTPKMVVAEGDSVKIGSVLFHDKYHPEIKFVSPVSGTVKTINRGERRRILEVVVENDNKDESLDFGKSDPATMDRDAIVGKLLEGGAWPYLRQRPYDILANPSDTPKAIFVSGFDSSPLAPDYDFVLTGQEEAFKVGVEVLKKLAPVVHIGISAGSASKVYNSLQGVTLNSFSGPHPVGNVGVQIHHVSPINKGEKVWVINPQEIVSIGNLFAQGKHDFSRVIAVTGSEVLKPLYLRYRLGASVVEILKDNIAEGSLRVISGNVLTGTNIGADGYLGFYHSQLCVIPEGDDYEFLGWASPGFGKFSVSRSFFSWICKNKKYRLNANLHGSERAIVVSGLFEKVVPMDILPEQLIKAILAEDIDKMEQLGLYEIVEEDIALCEFVDISKMELQAIVRDGINLMMKELG
ncbi:MAG TPA: NADH:ubiquinone reductase (Na(+)-transporting) subunit A [Marinilabiliaceae bacterium]|nr:NADH:ubiquinone reductase (Na(+)-transporting) subunit A [Marinilabiliaceae bacterium]HBX89207.1 NADH:ubiquinone reductase (Na(+)-transporting) subunit A [Marinilabiliaceae bacterium]